LARVRRGSGRHKYSALDQINRGNVRELTPAWTYRSDDMTQQPASTIECNPIVIDGVVYLTSPGLKLLALDAATGRQRWVFDPSDGKGGRGVNRGVTLWSEGADRRIFLAAGMFLYAVDADTGKLVKRFGTTGRVDLREGLDRDVFAVRFCDYSRHCFQVSQSGQKATACRSKPRQTARRR